MVEDGLVIFLDGLESAAEALCYGVMETYMVQYDSKYAIVAPLLIF